MKATSNLKKKQFKAKIIVRIKRGYYMTESKEDSMYIMK